MTGWAWACAALTAGSMALVGLQCGVDAVPLAAWAWGAILAAPCAGLGWWLWRSDVREPPRAG